MMLTIGVVNNMPTAAIKSTERQFCDILGEAAQGLSIQIRWFRLAGARPGHYERLDALWESHLDGLIVTGAEPRAAVLTDEPFWEPLTKTIDWATRHTSSAVWSCLATHAAVLHLDGVQRRKRPKKVFGVFDSLKTSSDHPILTNVQACWRVPHSRWNDLPEADLEASGYEMLSKSPEAGVDTFVKQFDRSLFWFIQSHPEYDAGALMREYRRDVARFHVGQMERYPEVPQNYFDRGTVEQLDVMRNDAMSVTEMLERTALHNGWKPIAVQLYRNWLSYLVRNRNLVPAG
jgi:homoserine O-succinyltransferase/O-acetyltransferase